MTETVSLREQQAELTRKLIIDSSIDILTAHGGGELAIRAVAAAAGMSERTVFRYFGSRDELLDAVAAEMNARQDHPPLPETVNELRGYPAAIFARFEANPALTRAALHSEVYERIRTVDLSQRGERIRRILDDAAPDRDPKRRRLAAANIHYHVVASTWNYYRFRFGFSAKNAVAAARLAIDDTLAGLGL